MNPSERAFARERVLGHIDLAEGTFEISCSWSGPPPEPGQFFMLRAERSGVLLGRPLSVYRSEPGALAFAITGRGRGTRELGELREDDGILLEGPLGSAWSVAPLVQRLLSGKTLERSEGGPRLALVGGGIGLAPLLFLAKRLHPNSYHIFAGYRSETWGLEGFAPESVSIFTEDGGIGRRGRVLDGLDPASFDAVLACGPEPMLRGLARIAASSGVPAWLSLEARMACGVGACLGCTVRTTAGNRRACVEGPIFPAHEVIFDE